MVYFVIVKTCLKIPIFDEPCLVAGAERVDIGLPYYRPHRTKEVRERREVMKDNKKNVELERALRLRTCERPHTARAILKLLTEK